MTAGGFWLALSRGGRIEELEREECRELLAATSVGRLGYVTDDGPRVVPVNFALAEGQIMFRTLADGEIARCVPGQRVAFEIDEVDPYAEGPRTLFVPIRVTHLSGRRVLSS